MTASSVHWSLKWCSRRKAFASSPKHSTVCSFVSGRFSHSPYQWISSAQFTNQRYAIKRWTSSMLENLNLNHWRCSIGKPKKTAFLHQLCSKKTVLCLLVIYAFLWETAKTSHRNKTPYQLRWNLDYMTTSGMQTTSGCRQAKCFYMDQIKSFPAMLWVFQDES